MMSEINLIEDNLWDHYSGLPNPAWYQYKKQLKNSGKIFGKKLELFPPVLNGGIFITI